MRIKIKYEFEFINKKRTRTRTPSQFYIVTNRINYTLTACTMTMARKDFSEPYKTSEFVSSFFDLFSLVAIFISLI